MPSFYPEDSWKVVFADAHRLVMTLQHPLPPSESTEKATDSPKESVGNAAPAPFAVESAVFVAACVYAQTLHPPPPPSQSPRRYHV